MIADSGVDEIITSSLNLLDDPTNVPLRLELERFSTLDPVVQASLDASQPNEVRLAENAEAFNRVAAEYVVLTSSLGQRTSHQKLQNETLIKALQELRVRMNDAKYRSGKVIPS